MDCEDSTGVRENDGGTGDVDCPRLRRGIGGFFTDPG
jgi:hypothetical protein